MMKSYVSNVNKSVEYFMLERKRQYTTIRYLSINAVLHG